MCRPCTPRALGRRWERSTLPLCDRARTHAARSGLVRYSRYGALHLRFPQQDGIGRGTSGGEPLSIPDVPLCRRRLSLGGPRESDTRIQISGCSDLDARDAGALPPPLRGPDSGVGGLSLYAFEPQAASDSLPPPPPPGPPLASPLR